MDIKVSKYTAGLILKKQSSVADAQKALETANLAVSELVTMIALENGVEEGKNLNYSVKKEAEQHYLVVNDVG